MSQIDDRMASNAAQQPTVGRFAEAPDAPALNGHGAFAPTVPAPAPKPFTITPPAATISPKTQDQKHDATLLDYRAGTSLRNLLQQASELNASDLHVHHGAPLRVRLHGEFRVAAPGTLSREESERLILDLLDEKQRQQLDERFQLDFAYEIPGIGRYRASAYRQRGGLDAVFRAIRPAPPTLEGLGLPEELAHYTDYHQGMVLFTGPAGCGKSSTMAAMVDLINQRRSDHILIIEDPIEYVYTPALCNVSQREAGIHTESFPRALRAALREDPDVIVIGELRDFESISLAVTAAETGHLVLGTLHTPNAIRTINRLLGVFPPDQQNQIRMMLSESLRVVISQHLAKRADGKGRVAALEIMVNNKAVGNLIRENRTYQIQTIMQTGAAQGQRLLDASLAELVRKKVITVEEAQRHAEDPESIK